MPFDTSTRLTRVQLPAMVRTAVGGGNLTAIQLPKTGLLARIYLDIRGTIAGTLSAPNALGNAALLRNVRLTANSGLDLFNISGAGYHYMLRNFQENYIDPVPASTARAAVTAAAYDVSMLIEMQINKSDPIGLIMLQNEQTVLSLSIQWETDALMATGVTSITGTAIPYMEFFTVPQDPKDWPPLTIAHQIIEDQQAISGAGVFTYNWPRGNTYMRVLHGCTLLQAVADAWTVAQLRANQSNFIENMTPALANEVYASDGHPAVRVLGVIPFDFYGSSGLQSFGKSRDFIDSSKLTDLATLITATGAVTLYTVREQLVTLA